MKKLIVLLFFSTVTVLGIAQNDTTLVIERAPYSSLQGITGLDSYTKLFAGQEYTFMVLVTSKYDIRLHCNNAQIKLDKSSLRSTGPIRYKLTPINTGSCTIAVGVNIDEERSKILLKTYYNIVDCPAPPVYISGIKSGEAIHNLNDSTLMVCRFPTGSGLFDTYPMESWTAEIGERTFHGKDNVLSKELIAAINEDENRSTLYIKAQLLENKTGHKETEAVFIIR